MYVLYKLAQVPLRPEMWLLAGILLALALSLRRRERAGRAILIGTAVLFYALATRPMRDLLVRPLESRYPPVNAANLEPHDAIIVLGGGVYREPVSGEPTVVGTTTHHRLTRGLLLHRAGVAPRVVLAGGVADPHGHKPAESEAMYRLAVALGIPEEVLARDLRSRTTTGNAREVRKLLPDAQRIVLVTSALHLPRATRRFRAEGFDVTPAPADYLAPPGPWTPDDFLPGSQRLTHCGQAVHEWVGMLLGR